MSRCCSPGEDPGRFGPRWGGRWRRAYAGIVYHQHRGRPSQTWHYCGSQPIMCNVYKLCMYIHYRLSDKHSEYDTVQLQCHVSCLERTCLIHFRVLELRTGPLNIFLHEEKFFHSRKFARICRPGEGSAQVFDGESRFFARQSRCLTLVR